MILLVDNYDSFTFNLFQMLAELCGGLEPLVFRNDAVTLDQLRELEPDRIIISPRPGPAGKSRVLRRVPAGDPGVR